MKKALMFVITLMTVIVVLGCESMHMTGKMQSSSTQTAVRYASNTIMPMKDAIVSPAEYFSPTGFPDDFPALKDTGGLGEGKDLTGFGGIKGLDQAGNRTAIKKVPVILIHGNGASADNPLWSWQPMKSYLKKVGYNDSEIWAVSYQGATNFQVEQDDPHKKNIEDVRTFIDNVINYLGVKKVVLIGHSLGVGMVRGYLFGLDRDGTYKPDLARFDKVAGLIGLAGGNYGLGKGQGLTSASEFYTGGAFEVSTHKVPGADIWDDTPYGAKHMPATNTQGNTPLPDGRTYNDGKFGFCGTEVDVEDNDPRRIYYAGLTAIHDFCDLKLPNTSYLQGADINQGWNLGGEYGDPMGFFGHLNIIQTQKVFDQGILPILEKCNAAITR